MATLDQDIQQLGDALYDRFGAPLEAEHWGEYVAISRNGQLVRSPDLDELLDTADKVLGLGSFVFKIGERVVWNLR
jgi:hypothetical protein